MLEFQGQELSLNQLQIALGGLSTVHNDSTNPFSTHCQFLLKNQIVKLFEYFFKNSFSEWLWISAVASAVASTMIHGYYASIAFHQPDTELGYCKSFIVHHPSLFSVACIASSIAVTVAFYRLKK